MERQELITILKYLRDNYPDTRFNDAKNIVDSWEAEFGGESAEVVTRAVRFHVRKSRKWPTVAHIREIIRRNIQGLYETKIAIETKAIEKESVIAWENTICQLCPYLQKGQTEPCKICKVEGGRRDDDPRTAGS